MCLLIGEPLARAPGRATTKPIRSQAFMHYLSPTHSLPVPHLNSSGPAGGSSWSTADIYTLSSGRQVFVKTARGRDAASMFQGEAEGLRAMHGEQQLGLACRRAGGQAGRQAAGGWVGGWVNACMHAP